MFSLVDFVKTLMTAEATAPQRTEATRTSTKPARTVADPIMTQAIVTQAIAPGRKGQVKFQGSWWTARCSQGITLSPGNLVQVIDRQTITLYVEPVFSNAQGH